MNPDAVLLERRIKARPETVFSFFTDRDRWLSWQGVEPYRRIAFTWGWEGSDSPVAPGQSTVEITLEPDGPDGTLLRLAHTGLPLPAVGMHRDGWNHFLDRLRVRAAGGDPGPDPATI